MAAASEIRSHLERFLQKQITLRQFQEWFVPVAGAVHGKGNPEVEDLVDDIDMSLSEYSDGVLDGQQLREELRKLVRPFVAEQVRVVAISTALPQEFQMVYYGLTRKRARSESASTHQSFAVGR